MADFQKVLDRLKVIEELLLSQKVVLNLEEVACYTNLSKSYIYKLTSTGGIPCYRPKGKHLYFKKDEIDSWLLQNRKATNEELDKESSTYVTINSK